MVSDGVQHDGGVGREGVVSKPQDCEPGLTQPLVARCIFGLAQVMNAAVQLDHKLQIGAKEIDDGARDRRLATKLQALESSISEHSPQDSLWPGRSRA